MDFQIREIEVPNNKEEKPRRLFGIFSKKQPKYIKLKTMRILMVGIEPEYRNTNYFIYFVRLGEKLANKFHCKSVVLDAIHNEKIIPFAQKLGFQKFDGNAIKYLS